MEWTGQSLSLVRVLWADGVSATEIGNRLGTTKNAVIGMVHRLDLPRRKSATHFKTEVYTPERDELIRVSRRAGKALKSIVDSLNELPGEPISYKQLKYRARLIREPEWERLTPPMSVKSAKVERPATLPKPVVVKAVKAAPAPRVVHKPKVKVVQKPKPVAVPEVKAHPSAVVYKPLRPRACCWPIGTPGREGFHFCCEVSISGKPYCPTHYAKAYIRVKNALRDAA